MKADATDAGRAARRDLHHVDFHMAVNNEKPRLFEAGLGLDVDIE